MVTKCEFEVKGLTNLGQRNVSSLEYLSSVPSTYGNSAASCARCLPPQLRWWASATGLLLQNAQRSVVSVKQNSNSNCEKSIPRVRKVHKERCHRRSVRASKGGLRKVNAKCACCIHLMIYDAFHSIVAAVVIDVLLSILCPVPTASSSELTRNWYIAMEASIATFRPVKESRSTSFIQPGASSDKSFVSPWIPMLTRYLKRRVE